MIIREPDGSGTVYDQDLSEEETEKREADGEDSWVHHASIYDDAVRWALREEGEGDDERPAPRRPPTRSAQKRPCKQCPFRKASAAGWLGGSPPEGFIGTLRTGAQPLPCHSTVDYEKPDWCERFLSGRDPKHKLCAGALTLMANEGRVPRPSQGPEMPADAQTVFETARDFITHHRASKVHSWTDPAKGTVERVGLNAVRKHCKLPVLR